MSKPTLDWDTANRLLDEAVAAKGADYVLGTGGRWKYVRNGRPSCIVGHILAAAGVPIDELSQADTGSMTLANFVVPELVETDERTVKLLDAAQDNQDCAEPWGIAVENARQAVA